jgi:phage major head subunit gpT-like protein
MAYTMTPDISRMLVAGQKEIFTKNFESYPIEYTEFTQSKTANKKTETYDSMGNLKKAEEKPEGMPINYGKVTQAYQTSITNKTWANGYSHSMEAIKYDLYGVINSIKAQELSRTMRELEEEQAISMVDNALTVNLADGQPLASDSHPLVDSASLNDTLCTASSLKVPENHKTMINMFYDFKNQAGGKMKTYPTDALTHYCNQLDIEEVYNSILKANEMSNTKNQLPRIKWHYSTYIADTNAWMFWDSRFDHLLYQKFMGVEFDNDTDKISTKNVFFNAIEIFNVGAVPNVGIVYNAGA